MQVTLPREAILQAVQRCQSVVEKRHTVPILANLYLEAGNDELRVSATDLEVGMRTRTSATVNAPGKTTVSARKLFELIRELSDEFDVVLRQEENFLHVESGRARFRLATLPADEFPTVPEDDLPDPIAIDGAELAQMIAATSFAMSQDETRKYLTGTLFEMNEDGRLCLVATDGHRLAFVEATVGGDRAGQCIVPRKAVTEMRRLADEAGGDVELYLGERLVRLSTGPHTLTTKLIDARFPVYRDVIPADNPYVATIDRAAFDQVLRRCMIVANEFTHDVRLAFSPGRIEITAHNTEQEQMEETVETEYEGGEASIGFNGRYLRDALGAVKEPTVRMILKDGLSPVMLHGDGNEATRYVIMPMRI